MSEDESSTNAFSRRSLLLAAAGGSAIAAFGKAHGIDIGSQPVSFRQDTDQNDVLNWCVHEGKGKIDMKIFRFDGAPRPAVLLIYTIPPGNSEGVHVHRPGNKELGSYDEFYYIMQGSGEMQIDGRTIAVKTGDHVFTPNGVEHGIENTAKEGDLKVYMVAVIRD